MKGRRIGSCEVCGTPGLAYRRLIGGKRSKYRIIVHKVKEDDKWKSKSCYPRTNLDRYPGAIIDHWILSLIKANPGQALPKRSTLAKKANVSKRTIQRSLKTLLDLDWIRPRSVIVTRPSKSDPNVLMRLHFKSYRITRSGLKVIRPSPPLV